MEPLTTDNVRSALAALAPDLEITVFAGSTATSQWAAEAIGCELGQIAKSLLFLVEDRPVLVIASGDTRVDDRKLAAMYGVTRKKVRFANAEQCIAITGYAPGGVPPVGHRTPDLPKYLDDALRRYAVVYPAAGADNAVFGISTDRLATITGGPFADLRKIDEANA
jgi:prolyl-tRNA editing enzyme YbaK/EbsC (Cys-tRNA(Pro) deacylase)